jgi:hypothetical protein
MWQEHLLRHKRQSLAGFNRLVRRSEVENMPWLPARPQRTAPHDEATPPEQQRTTYFLPPKFYCIETICAPCGVVIAWTKFAKSESPTNILQFLQSVYPIPSTRPSYVCIDKACMVLRTAISAKVWDEWRGTTCFIVDSYHYINHRVQDYLCRTWCNPAPLNGSAPNLVIVEKDNNGVEHYKRAFNTQASSLISVNVPNTDLFCRLVNN